MTDLQAPEPPPQPRRGEHWASNPQKRRLLLIGGPFMILGLGLWDYRDDPDSLAMFLVAFPIVAAGLVLATLWIGELGAADYEGRPEPKHRRVLALIALGVAAAAIPVAAAIRQGVDPIGIEVLLVVAMGVVLMILVPGDLAPNWVLVPVATTVGAIMAGVSMFIASIGSLWGGGEGDAQLHALVAWMLTAILTYIGLGLMTETKEHDHLPWGTMVNGIIATLMLSLAGFLFASFSLS